MEVSSGALVRVLILLLYVPVCLIVFWRLVPRLSPISKRLATIMLAAQVLIIVVSLETRPGSTSEFLFWYLDGEGNFPAALAATQLALVGAVAMLVAWLARARPTGHRLYFAAIGLVFLYWGVG